MKQLIFTSEAFNGEVFLEFGDNGMLSKYDISNATLSIRQQEWFLQRLPTRLEDVKRILENSQTGKLTEVKNEITFEMFWNRYNDKVNSSKRKAETRWNRMTKADQIKAYNFINRYEQNIPAGVRKKYAETYLNTELWNN